MFQYKLRTIFLWRQILVWNFHQQLFTEKRWPCESGHWPLGTWIHTLTEHNEFDNLILNQKNPSIHFTNTHPYPVWMATSPQDLGVEHRSSYCKWNCLADLMYLQQGLSSVHHMAAYQWYHLCSCTNLMSAKWSHEVLAIEEKPFVPNWSQGHSVSMNPRGNWTTRSTVRSNGTQAGLYQTETLHAFKCWLHVEPQWLWSF